MEQEPVYPTPLPADEQEHLCWKVYHARRAAQQIALHPNAACNQQLHAIIEQGQRAREQLIAHNMTLVVSIAQRYRVPGWDTEDLYHEGVFGLMRAIDKFDPRRGYRFSTYATHWIRQAIQRAVMQHAYTVRRPVHHHETMALITRTAEQLAHTLGRHPTYRDIAQALGWSPQRVATALQGNIYLQSLDRPIAEHAGGTRNLAEVVADPTMDDPAETALQRIDSSHLHRALSRLSPRERYVLAARYGLGTHDPQTLEAIGRQMGLTRERVRQIEHEALTKLRALFADESQATDGTGSASCWDGTSDDAR